MIEQDLARIAAALERIASHLDHPPAATAGAPVVATVTPVAAPVASIKEARAAKVAQDQPELSEETLRARMRAMSAQSPERRTQVIGVLKALGVPTLAKLDATRYPDLVRGLDALEAA